MLMTKPVDNFSLVVFDLDGTLTSTTHRDHLVEAAEYDEYYSRCDQDRPVWHAIDLLQMHVAAGHRVEIWTGRSAVVERQTKEWLDVYGIDPRLLVRMRARGDTRSAPVLKRQWLIDARAHGTAPSLAYDDRNDCAQMWRAEGVPCLLVLT